MYIERPPLFLDLLRAFEETLSDYEVSIRTSADYPLKFVHFLGKESNDPVIVFPHDAATLAKYGIDHAVEEVRAYGARGPQDSLRDLVKLIRS